MASHDPSKVSESFSTTLRRDSSSNGTPELSDSTSGDKSHNIEAAMGEVVEGDPNARPKVFRNAFEECIFVFTVMLATASTTFIQGVIVINTATIGAGLSMTPPQIVWISAAIGLASGSFVLFFGKTADLFGRKNQLLVGMAFLSLISLVAAFAPNAMSMNVLCGLLGLGTAAIAPPAIGTLFATYLPSKRRNKVAGALGAGNPVGFILGSISAGLATKLSSWRASFVVIAIFFLIMTLLALWTMPSIPRSGNVRLGAKRFDYFGTVLIIVGMSTFSAALTLVSQFLFWIFADNPSEGPELGWTSFNVVTILVAGVACLIGFAAWERVYTHPLLDPSVWMNKNFTLCILCTLFGYMSFITNQFWISLYMQDIQNYAPLDIAVKLLPQAIAGILWSYVAQFLVSRMCCTIIMGIGAVAYIAGATLLMFTRQETSYWRFLFPSLCITVMGADFQFVAATLYINQQMKDQASLAAGVLQTAMRLSISLGLGITSAVYMSMGQKLRFQSDVNMPFERAYLCSIVFAGLGFVFVPFMRLNTKRYKSAPQLFVEEPTAGEETADRQSTHSIKGNSAEHRHMATLRDSDSSGDVSMVSHDSQDSYFPRFSWESKYNRLGGHHIDERVTYEVCMKCREIRRVVVVSHGHLEEGRIPEVELRHEKDLEKGEC